MENKKRKLSGLILTSSALAGMASTAATSTSAGFMGFLKSGFDKVKNIDTGSKLKNVVVKLRVVAAAVNVTIVSTISGLYSLAKRAANRPSKIIVQDRIDKLKYLGKKYLGNACLAREKFEENLKSIAKNELVFKNFKWQLNEKNEEKQEKLTILLSRKHFEEQTIKKYENKKLLEKLTQLFEQLSKEEVEAISENPNCITSLIENFELEKILKIIKSEDFKAEKFFEFFDEFFKEKEDFEIFNNWLESKNFNLNKLVDNVIIEGLAFDVSLLKSFIKEIVSDDDGYALKNFLDFLSKISEHGATSQFFFLLILCGEKIENLANLFKNEKFKDFVEKFVDLLVNNNTKEFVEKFKKEDFNAQKVIEDYLSNKVDNK